MRRRLRLLQAAPAALQAGEVVGVFLEAAISRWLKAALGTAARAAARTKDATYLGARYRRLSARIGRLKALVAIEHSIITAVRHMLTNNVAFQRASHRTGHIRHPRARHCGMEYRSLPSEVGLPWPGWTIVSSGSRSKILDFRSSMRDVKSVGFVVRPGPPGKPRQRAQDSS